MDAEQAFAETAAIRRDIADVLSSLDKTALQTPSLREGWDVLAVAADLAVSVTTPLPVVMAAVIRHGGSVSRANRGLAFQMRRRPNVLELLAANAGKQLSPPRTGPIAPLADAVIHAADIYLPLGLVFEPSDRALTATLDYLVTIRPMSLVRRGSLSDLRIVADDLDCSFGAGAEVSGRGLDLILAICGRSNDGAELHGPGLKTLLARTSRRKWRPAS